MGRCNCRSAVAVKFEAHTIGSLVPEAGHLGGLPRGECAAACAPRDCGAPVWAIRAASASIWEGDGSLAARPSARATSSQAAQPAQPSSTSTDSPSGSSASPHRSFLITRTGATSASRGSPPPRRSRKDQIPRRPGRDGYHRARRPRKGRRRRPQQWEPTTTECSGSWSAGPCHP